VPPLWRDRTEAGHALAHVLQGWQARRDALLLGLPRGGVAVAAAVADQLQLQLATWAVRKLTHPTAPEYAIGALAPLGVVLWDQEAVRRFSLSPDQQQRLVETQLLELERRQQLYGDPSAASLRGRHLLVIDDGIATGLTVRAALTSLRRTDPASLVLAVPVVDHRVVPLLQPLVDELVALAVVDHLRAVGEWFGHFEQLRDQQVLALLAQHGRIRADLP
jgi:putative phosphoribosyl transferase